MLRLHIRRTPSTLDNEIFIFEEPDKEFGSVGWYLTFNDKGESIAKQIVRDGSGESIKPSFILGEQTTRELIQAFSNLAKERGMEPDSESKAKGKLEATERHLSDLRQLLKLK